MKKLMYLAITFFTFIFSFIAPIKNNFNININNNKIVEKLDPKRAFENAPTKQVDLPGVNKEFKLFFNFTTALEIKDFMIYLTDYEYSIPEGGQTLLFSGVMENPIEPGNFINLYMSIGRFSIGSNTGIEFFLTAIFGDDIEALLNLKYIAISDSFVLNFGETDISDLSNEGNNQLVNESISFLNNDFFSLATINSINSLGETDVTDFLSSQDYIYGYDVVSTSPVPGLIATINSIASGLLSLLISLFSSVVSIFWNVSNNTPTFLGVVLLFVVAVPITYWVINFVIGLIRKIRLTRGK